MWIGLQSTCLLLRLSIAPEPIRQRGFELSGGDLLAARVLRPVGDALTATLIPR